MHSEALCRHKPVQDNNSDTTGGCSGKINYSDLFLLPLIQVLVFHSPQSLATVPSLLQDLLHGTASLYTPRTCHRWRLLNQSSKPIFLNSSVITAIKFLSLCTAPFPSALAVLQCYVKHLIIIVIISTSKSMLFVVWLIIIKIFN